MNTGCFRSKTIRSEDEVGILLKQERERQGYSQEEIAKVIGISVRYIRALEEEDVTCLPGHCYTRHFLRAYLHILNIDSSLFPHFENRFDKLYGTSVGLDYTGGERVIFPFITPAFFRKAAIALPVSMFLVFVIGQFFSTLKVPSADIQYPIRPSIVSQNKIIVEGSAAESNTVLLNGQEVVRRDEAFLETVDLVSGLNDITVTVRNKFGENTEHIYVYYDYSSSALTMRSSQ